MHLRCKGWNKSRLYNISVHVLELQKYINTFYMTHKSHKDFLFPTHG